MGTEWDDEDDVQDETDPTDSGDLPEVLDDETSRWEQLAAFEALCMGYWADA